MLNKFSGLKLFSVLHSNRPRNDFQAGISPRIFKQVKNKNKRGEKQTYTGQQIRSKNLMLQSL
jgi:hypothetical protein